MIDSLLRILRNKKSEPITNIPYEEVEKLCHTSLTQGGLKTKKEIKEVKHNLKHLTDYAIDYFNRLREKYGKGRERKTEIKLFDKVAQTKDDMGQMALYHIGEVYMKKGDNAAARKAFEVCSSIESRPKLQEDALYNFAVLSYKLDVNPFNEAQRALSQFLTKYPNSERKNDVYEYLVNVYTQTSNYDDPILFRPIILNSANAVSFSIDYTLRIYNRSDGTQIIKKARITSFDVKKYHEWREAGC
jgi:tetratricopeptide (TPR) repeat protein